MSCNFSKCITKKQSEKIIKAQKINKWTPFNAARDTSSEPEFLIKYITAYITARFFNIKMMKQRIRNNILFWLFRLFSRREIKNKLSIFFISLHPSKFQLEKFFSIADIVILCLYLEL